MYVQAGFGTFGWSQKIGGRLGLGLQLQTASARISNEFVCSFDESPLILASLPRHLPRKVRFVHRLGKGRDITALAVEPGSESKNWQLDFGRSQSRELPQNIFALRTDHYIIILIKNCQ